MKDETALILIICVSMIAGALMGIMICTDGYITAMDVYQGKTTLEYTVIDGVKVDSCVIFKK